MGSGGVEPVRGGRVPRQPAVQVHGPHQHAGDLRGAGCVGGEPGGGGAVRAHGAVQPVCDRVGGDGGEHVAAAGADAEAAAAVGDGGAAGAGGDDGGDLVPPVHAAGD